ncbi:SAM-dependent methyltransferase [Nonomuraea sp. 10N515B]|uniref:SAM-dependent methyltransferase n=1 Tax=Nonomuraea sp. 10N515B TaxID=3457422 RepID=UPI003FCEE115
MTDTRPQGRADDAAPVQPARQAEVYNALYGGKDHLGPDHDLAAEIRRIFPGAPQAARANQEFLRRAVRHLADAGIYQFVDLGAGYPAEPHLDTVAEPGARFAYVDRNPTVCCHLRALCRGDGVVTIEHDLRDIDAVLDDPELRAVIKPRVPTAVIMGAVWHFMTDAEVTHLIGRLRKRLAHGSHLVFSVGRRDGLLEEKVAAAVKVYTEHVSPVVLRTRQEILQLLTGCALISPGLVKTYAWRPDDPDDITRAVNDDGTPHLYAGVARIVPVPRLGVGLLPEER